MSDSSAGWSDQELIERIRRSEQLAFQELFWRFQTLLVRYARQLGVQPALREVDLTRFDGHLTSPRLGAEVFNEISETGQRHAAA